MWRWLQSLWKSDAAEEKPKVAPAHLEPARKAEGVGKSQPHKTPKPTQETSSVPEATPEAATAKQIRFRVQRGQVRTKAGQTLAARSCRPYAVARLQKHTKSCSVSTVRPQVVGVENTVQRYREDKPVKLHNTPFVERVVTVMQVRSKVPVS